MSLRKNKGDVRHTSVQQSGMVTDSVVQGKRRVLASVQERRETIDFSGPLPPPEILERYRSVDAETVQWLKDRADKEQAHRHALDVKYASHVLFYEKVGMLSALVVVLASLCGVVFGFYLGIGWPASILGSSTILGLAYAFLDKRRSQRAEKTTEEP